MITKEQILEIIQNQVEEDGFFVVDVKVRAGNRILVCVDGAQGITIESIKKISRLIEGSFDREVEDFELEVSSPGIGQPFKVLQQYIKNRGKQVEVTVTANNVVQGVLEVVEPDSFTIKVEKMEKREGEKKKSLHVEMQTYNYKDVKSVIEIITF